ncbi:MAG: hypothetical protein ACJ72D_11420 [Marmoricola sp.]
MSALLRDAVCASVTVPIRTTPIAEVHQHDWTLREFADEHGTVLTRFECGICGSPG